MDPFSLIAAGVGTVGSLAGGIANAASAPGRKRKWKREQKKDALFNLDRQYGSDVASLTGGMRLPTYEIDAMHNNHAIDRQANEQFRVDPMSFVPFVQNGANLANQVYQGVQDSSAPEERLAPDPIARQQQASSTQQAALERAQAMQYFKQQGWKPYGGQY